MMEDSLYAGVKIDTNGRSRWNWRTAFPGDRAVELTVELTLENCGTIERDERVIIYRILSSRFKKTIEKTEHNGRNLGQNIDPNFKIGIVISIEDSVFKIDLNLNKLCKIS